MSHPRAEVDPGVEAEVEEAEAEEGVVPRKTDSKEGDNSHSEDHGNPEEPRGRGQRFDKSPNVKKPRVNAKTPNQDKGQMSQMQGIWTLGKRLPTEPK